MNEEFDPVWRALSSPIRRRMLDLLRDGALTTGALAEAFPELSRFAVMQHLGVLEQANIVLVHRRGRERFNFLNPIPVRQIYERWVSELASQGAEAALRLKQHTEQTEGDKQAMQVQNEGQIEIQMELFIDAPVERVYRAVLNEFDEWWPHRFREDSKVVVEAWPGGRIYEDWGNGQGALYATIVYLEPPYKLGSRGPGALSGAFTNASWEILQAQGSGTLYKKRMFVWGSISPDQEQMFRNGMQSIFQSLKTYLEEGKGRA